jgi:WD40 repeat protein
VSVIASTIEDPNKIISKSQQTSSHINAQYDNCIIITGSKLGDVIVWKFNAELTNNPAQAMQKLRQFFDHDEVVTSIFIHQEMQMFATSSSDGSCNLYSLMKLELLRCFKHPFINPLSTVVLSYQPLASVAMFSTFDRTWISFSING